MLVKNTTINISYKMRYINAKKLTSKILEKQLIKHKTNDMICCRMQKKQNRVLTGKNPGPMGPPGIPSFGGICPSGLGAGPAFYKRVSHQYLYD